MSERPYHALRHRDFRRIWLSQLVSQVGSQMQVVALNWHVYLLTGSALALGFVGLTRVVPIILFSLMGGVVADRWDRRKVMLAAQTGMALVAVALAALTFAGADRLFVLYALNALQACCAAFDNPARQSLIPRLVPPRELPAALSLNLTAFHVAMIGGPAIAGLLIAGGGAALAPNPTRLHMAGASGAFHMGWIYLLNAISFGGVIFALATMHTSGRVDPAAGAPESAAEALRSGLRFVFTTPIMVWTTALDFFATFFSGAMSLLPIVADQVLHVGPVGYGWLVSAPAVGAVLGSFYTAVRPLPKRQGVVLLAAVGAYGLATVLYGLSRNLWLTLIALALTGLADLVSTVIRQTLRQVITPDGLRGRMTSVNMIFFMGGPQLGEMEAGLVASLFATAAIGATVSIVTGGVATLLCAGAVAAAAPVVRDFDLDAYKAS